MNKPTRILHMIASLYAGGSQAMIMNIYRNIDRSKYQFDFIVDHPEYDFYKSEIEELGGKIYVMPSFNGDNVNEVKKAWNNFFDKHKEYKILHSHSRSYASIYIPIAKKHGLKTIIHSHNTSNGKGISAIVKNLMQYPLRHQADYFIGCSKKAGEWLFGSKIVSSDRFFVLNNSIDTRKFSYDVTNRNEYRDSFGIKDEKVIIQIGSFIEQKNHIFTIDMFNELLMKNQNCVLYLVGDGPLKEKIQKQVESYKINDKVKFLGQRKDVSKLLQMADYYIMPSLFEGLSVAAVEAQASGIECLLSDKVNDDIIITKNCKLLPLDINKWCDELLKDIPNRENTEKEIKNAGFDIEDNTKKISEFYERIVL